MGMCGLTWGFCGLVVGWETDGFGSLACCASLALMLIFVWSCARSGVKRLLDSGSVGT